MKEILGSISSRITFSDSDSPFCDCQQESTDPGKAEGGHSFGKQVKPLNESKEGKKTASRLQTRPVRPHRLLVP